MYKLSNTISRIEVAEVRLSSTGCTTGIAGSGMKIRRTLADGDVQRSPAPPPGHVDAFPIVDDHVGRLLADHYHRRVDVAAGDLGHDAGVDHSQSLDAVHSELVVHDGQGIAGRSHFRRA